LGVRKDCIQFPKTIFVYYTYIHSMFSNVISDLVTSI